MNSRLFKGNLHFQALGTNFRVWSDGIVSPLYEELPSTAQLIALEYDDVEGRHALMHDPRWVEEFRRDWLHGRTGGDWASFKARLGCARSPGDPRPGAPGVRRGAGAGLGGETFEQVLRAPAALLDGVRRHGSAPMPSARPFAACETPPATTRTSCCS
jgi:hypothetical protein